MSVNGCAESAAEPAVAAKKKVITQMRIPFCEINNAALLISQQQVLFTNAQFGVSKLKISPVKQHCRDSPQPRLFVCVYSVQQWFPNQNSYFDILLFFYPYVTLQCKRQHWVNYSLLRYQKILWILIHSTWMKYVFQLILIQIYKKNPVHNLPFK